MTQNKTPDAKSTLERSIISLLTSDGCISLIESSRSRQGTIVSLFEYRMEFLDNPIINQILVEISNNNVEISMENKTSKEAVSYRKMYSPSNEDSVNEVPGWAFDKFVWYADEYLTD